ncbi:hypothetical protein ACFWYW_56165 [Nonomuraea sp. NPDC059023]|uniref:hypothetical protein n=1 Tax=unclassified Nonomuraea TaxID=2593643 RepID=UPI0036A68000
MHESDDAFEHGGLPDEEWAPMTPEQRLHILMAVNAADEEVMPPEVAERARDAYRHPYR